MVSSEWAAPNTFKDGFKLGEVAEGKYGQRLYFWNWSERTLLKEVELEADGGLIPLEVRFLHDPKSSDGYVATALSSAFWHWYKDPADNKWNVHKVLQLDAVDGIEGWPCPVPALVSDLVVSLDDRFLYLVSWFHGAVHQYNIEDRSKPKLVGQVHLSGGLVGNEAKVRAKRAEFAKLQGGPQMIQLSLDGKRLYVTNSLYSSWDEQFYPKLGQEGGHMVRIDVDTEKGGLEIDESFLVSFGDVEGGKYRPHEMRYPGGDCTSDIWL
jgi:selenium-binding protein 1